MESNQNDQNEQLEIEYQNEKSVSKEERIARERQKVRHPPPSGWLDELCRLKGGAIPLT
jgi:hypothetical protein